MNDFDTIFADLLAASPAVRFRPAPTIRRSTTTSSSTSSAQRNRQGGPLAPPKPISSRTTSSWPRSCPNSR
ncbi:MAG: hypothetical protein R2856_25015 [Caldilineaceae bacterium]